MKSGPSRVNAPLEGPVIPRSRRDLFKDQSFGESDNAGIRQTGRTRVRRSMQRKRWGWSAPGMVQCRGNEEMGKQFWVSAWCLREVYKKE